MFNVVNNNVIGRAMGISVMALMMSACGGSDPDKEAANRLLASADSCMQVGNSELAVSLLDSIDVKYPLQIEARQRAMDMRPGAIEQATLHKIAQADSLLGIVSIELAEFEGKMRRVAGNGLEGYYVVADGYNPNFISATGVEPRVNDTNFTYYIVAQNTKRPIGINQVGLAGSAGEEKSKVIPSQSERVVGVEGSELATFLAEEVDDLGAWAWDNANDISQVIIYGAKGTEKLNLKPKQAAAFGTAWKYSQLKLKQRNARIIREKLDRQLQIARDQKANTVNIE